MSILARAGVALQAESGPLSLVQLGLLILGIAALALGVWYLVRLNAVLKRSLSDLQLRVLERERAVEPGSLAELSMDDLVAAPQLLIFDVTHFVARFVVLSIAELGWSVLFNLLSTPLSLLLIQLFPTNLQIANFGSIVIRSLGSLVLLLFFGVPLLLEIMRAVGVRAGTPWGGPTQQ